MCFTIQALYKINCFWCLIYLRKHIQQFSAGYAALLRYLAHRIHVCVSLVLSLLSGENCATDMPWISSEIIRSFHKSGYHSDRHDTFSATPWNFIFLAHVTARFTSVLQYFAVLPLFCSCHILFIFVQAIFPTTRKQMIVFNSIVSGCIDRWMHQINSIETILPYQKYRKINCYYKNRIQIFQFSSTIIVLSSHFEYVT